VLGVFAAGCFWPDAAGCFEARAFHCTESFASDARGIRRAFIQRMPVRRFQDLLCWRLSNELKCEVAAFTAREPAAKDFKYCNQIRDASASVTRNIAEGFGRFTPGEFAQYLKFARASLMETQDQLIDGRQREYLDAVLFSRLMNLLRAALKTTTNLMLSKQAQTNKNKRTAKRGSKDSV
jgi:four helix bundle protein